MEYDNIFFLALKAEEELPANLGLYTKAIVVLESEYENKTQLFRKSYLAFLKAEIKNPVILKTETKEEDSESFQIYSSIDVGASLIDGFGDGIWLKGKQSSALINTTSFGILQATRTRISKTEYISCPSCGRTLFDLQETTAKIRARTDHLKGLKIGIMGCIVNGPGEMADADYGYVGTGPGKINLYKEKTVVKRNIPEAEAVEALVDLIKENGDWAEVHSD
jgi:(E)-4-hydroxy-3-methylbut-2-enyl-diphosphate synthase